jgi:hypothetical protein
MLPPSSPHGVTTQETTSAFQDSILNCSHPTSSLDCHVGIDDKDLKYQDGDVSNDIMSVVTDSYWDLFEH